MKTEAKNNKPNSRYFTYALGFFILTNLGIYFNPDKTRELILSLPSTIKSKIIFSNFYPTLDIMIDFVMILVIIFLLYSLYFGITFVRDEPDSNKLFKLVPKSISGFIAILLIIVCLVYVKLIVFELVNVFL